MSDSGTAIVKVEEGFVDIDLPIREVATKEDGTIVVLARGIVNGASIGFIVELVPSWKAQPTDGFCPYWGTVRIKRDVEHSDRLVALLSTLYGLESWPGRMSDCLEIQAVGLNDNPENVLSARTNMKVFFQPVSESGYAEVFINVDIPSGMLELHEKDVEYRQPLVSALCGVA